jgi:hypothetical protein
MNPLMAALFEMARLIDDVHGCRAKSEVSAERPKVN